MLDGLDNSILLAFHLSLLFIYYIRIVLSSRLVLNLRSSCLRLPSAGISFVFGQPNYVVRLLPGGIPLLDMHLDLALAWKLRGSDSSLKDFRGW